MGEVYKLNEKSNNCSALGSSNVRERGMCACMCVGNSYCHGHAKAKDLVQRCDGGELRE